jgi:hypothetical protein
MGLEILFLEGKQVFRKFDLKLLVDPTTFQSDELISLQYFSIKVK